MAKLIDSVSHGVPALTEIITLGRTLKKRAADVLAYFDRPGTSNGPTEAINGRLEHLRGSALGFRNLTNYIARSLLETGGFRPQLHPHCEEPVFAGQGSSGAGSRRLVPAPDPWSEPCRWHSRTSLAPANSHAWRHSEVTVERAVCRSRCTRLCCGARQTEPIKVGARAARTASGKALAADPRRK